MKFNKFILEESLADKIKDYVESKNFKHKKSTMGGYFKGSNAIMWFTREFLTNFKHNFWEYIVYNNKKVLRKLNQIETVYAYDIGIPEIKILGEKFGVDFKLVSTYDMKEGTDSLNIGGVVEVFSKKRENKNYKQLKLD